MSLEALEGRELLSVAPVQSARHQAHHAHHVHHVRHQEAARTATATVVTDQLDYQPGQNAVITGNGFNPNEQVRLQVLHTDGTPNTTSEHQPWIVRADRHGTFQTTYPVGQDDLNTSLQVTAVGLGSNRTASEDFSDSAPIVRPDHIVIVIDEDRACNAIGDLVNMPYYNQLAASGLVYTDSHGVAHPASPNYLTLFSGSMQGITDNGNNHTFSGPNLASLFNSTQIAPGQYLSFGGFAESLPQDGDMTSRIAGDPNDPNHQPDLYMRNYNPMAEFTDMGTRNGVAITNAQVNKTFASFPTTAAGYASLPTVSFIIPNTLHNTHGSNEQDPYATDPAAYNFLRQNADTWLKNNLDGYLQWAKSNNSLLIVTGSEEETDTHPANTITTIVNGDPDLFVAGQNNTSVNHFNLVRTIEDMYGLTPLGDSANAAAFDTNALGQLSTGPQTGLSSTTTALVSSANPSVFGQSVTFTATIAHSGAGVPTGFVTFKDGTTVLGTGTLNASGIATFSTATLAGGAHSITAVYSGDTGFLGSTSATLAQTVSTSNDSFAGRIILSGASVTTTGSNATATKEAGEPSHAGNAGGKSVWYSWTASSSGTVTIDTAGSNFDTLLAVYTGNSVSALTAVSGGSNDDSLAGGTTTSKVTFNVTAGTVYQIAVDGYGGVAGNITLHIALSAGAPAAPLNVAATDGAFSDKVNISWTASAGATAYEVWRSTTNSSASATKISATDVTSTTFSDTTANSGTTYYYFVKAKNGGGTSAFSASDSGYRLMTNDAFANRAVLTGKTVTVTATNSGATKETGEPKHAGNAGGKSLWWTWTAPSAGTVTIDTAGSNFDTLLAVYTGTSVSTLTPVTGGSNDDSPAGGTTTSKVTFAVTAGTVYQIAVDGYGGVAGNITLHLNLV